MKGPVLKCEKGAYDSEMRVICRETGMGCAWQEFRSCRGWWEQTEKARECGKGRGEKGTK